MRCRMFCQHWASIGTGIIISTFAGGRCWHRCKHYYQQFHCDFHLEPKLSPKVENVERFAPSRNPIGALPITNRARYGCIKGQVLQMRQFDEIDKVLGMSCLGGLLHHTPRAG